MRRANIVVANSDFVRQSAIASGVPEAKTRLIHNVPPEPAEKANLETTPPAVYDGMTLLYVGAIAEHKGLIPLIEAMRDLLDAGVAAKLDIVGGSIYDVDFRKRVVARIRELNLDADISLVGSVSDPRSYYRRASLLVVPSLCEDSAANVVLEAKRESVPSVVFPSGGLAELVNHESDGYVCEQRTAAALATAIRWILQDPDRLSRMRVAARADYESRFALPRFSSQWRNAFGMPVVNSGRPS
jgi:glycosyltransferase involved in cell wall biosynthesis